MMIGPREWRAAPILALAFIVLASGIASALELRFSGQASAWALGSYGTDWLGQGGIRYLPALALGGKEGFGADVSFDGWTEAVTDFRDSLNIGLKVKPYRATVRYARPRFDARLGLQKISFGSATLLRPLMWFDRIDPRDPLQLTDGVYALLARYYFQNNTNVWAWGLLGNSVTKGWEVYPSERWSPEFGGRVQLPVPRGEVGLTGLHRTVDWSDWIGIPEVAPRPGEDRVGLDGRWDIGLGAWFEGMLLRQEWWTTSGVASTWFRALTLGSDYTFRLGNGLSLLAEHLVANGERAGIAGSATANATALSLTYPLGLVDNVRALVYYDWSNKGLYRYLSWQRTLDNWVFNVAAFWNPVHSAGLAGTSAASTAAGKGLMVTVVFNH
jgi:hypothetical protein